MGDKVRGTFAILVGLFALYQSYTHYQDGRRGWHMWLLVAAGLVLILLGTWRVRRRPADPSAALLK